MALRTDREAASPLVVIATFILGASGLTALLFFAFVDTAPASITLQETEESGLREVHVVAEHGGLAWENLEVRFVDVAGRDHAALYLEVPTGSVQPGDRIALRSAPPAGPYLLRIFQDGQELARLAVTV